MSKTFTFGPVFDTEHFDKLLLSPAVPVRVEPQTPLELFGMRVVVCNDMPTNTFAFSQVTDNGFSVRLDLFRLAPDGRLSHRTITKPTATILDALT